jgi:hypothetical protein
VGNFYPKQNLMTGKAPLDEVVFDRDNFREKQKHKMFYESESRSSKRSCENTNAKFLLPESGSGAALTYN